MLAVFFVAASLVSDVRSLIAAHDFADADRDIRSVQASQGGTPEVAAALSWMARGELEARQYDRADSYAMETRKLADALLKNHKLDAEPFLQTAVGASIEVHAQALAARGERPDAVEFLRGQSTLFAGTTLSERIRKNINLLSLEGHAAPALDEIEYLGSKPVSLASLKGHPVLLFFWAHWCSDCKAEVAILAQLRREYAPQGLVVIAPTRLYGYAANGQDATPAAEKNYIEQIRQRYYADLADVPAPLSAANFITYGASTTPTLVLIDRTGIVRYYHPGALAQAELSARIQSILKK